MGSDDAKYDRWISKQIDEYKDYFNPDLPAQVTMLLLRLSAIPQLGYFARVIPPRLLLPHAVRFDQMVVDTAIQKFALPTPYLMWQKYLLHCPLRLVA